MSRSPRRTTSAAAAVIAALMPLTAACSDDAAPAAQTTPTPVTAEPTPFSVRADVGNVTGRLGRSDRREVLRDVREVVADWMEAAYVETGSAVDLGTAFADFTPQAAASAKRQRALLTNAALASADGVEVRPAVVKVDVLAPGGEVAAATARFRVVLQREGAKRQEKVVGRLMLSPVKKGWKVFGFTVERGSFAPADKTDRADQSKAGGDA
ncbi:hypothetical protein E8D34_03780 [Nocardioides sp. GY 10113]|uniref:hypothetical protein n=1 Tax=Nocardioides sp. GY 10113 TaxID=2569761 RepID=UPI0010A7DFC4|nr:hypothetical protein [Nocardioides sp. GY 10113]TIC88789.1 hypothetical protein E8D34_03780 [Nocardioides sp. GY 10113]